MLEQTPIAKTPDQRGGYGQLTAQIRELGLLRSRPWSYAGHFALVFAALAALVAAMVVWLDSWWLLLLAPAFGVIATAFGVLIWLNFSYQMLLYCAAWARLRRDLENDRRSVFAG